MKTFSKFLLSLACCLLTLPVNSQTNTTEEDSNEEPQNPWYQVEILIFAHNDPITDEIWPDDLGLKYPQRIVQLKQAAQTEVMLNDWPAPLQPTVQMTPTNPEPETPEPGPVTSDDDQSKPEQPAPLWVKLEEQPFTLLEDEQLTFTEISKRLFRRNNFRPLFHGAWRQPIGKRNDSESILIQGGDKFDRHYELEGSISLGLERYLHISTDLWLSAFVSNIGRESTLWPVLPKAPITSSAQSGSAVADPFSVNQHSSIQISSQEFINPFLEMAANQYAVDRTVTLRQQRRMRSNELHYIDHPLMGLLVRITPYTPPEPEPDSTDAESQEDLSEEDTGQQTSNNPQ